MHTDWKERTPFDTFLLFRKRTKNISPAWLQIGEACRDLAHVDFDKAEWDLSNEILYTHACS
jgi:hypothetical protein